MNYSVRFEAKLEGAEQWIPVGNQFITYPYDTTKVVWAACGSSPDAWRGKKCFEMLPFIDKGIKQLRSRREEYREFESSDGKETVEMAIAFLDAIRCVCEEYPTAVARVRF